MGGAVAAIAVAAGGGANDVDPPHFGRRLRARRIVGNRLRDRLVLDGHDHVPDGAGLIEALTVERADARFRPRILEPLSARLALGPARRNSERPAAYPAPSLRATRSK